MRNAAVDLHAYGCDCVVQMKELLSDPEKLAALTAAAAAAPAAGGAAAEKKEEAKKVTSRY